MAIPTASAPVPRFDDVGHLGEVGFRTADVSPSEVDATDGFILTSRGWVSLSGGGGIVIEQLEEPEVVQGAFWIRQEPG